MSAQVSTAREQTEQYARARAASSAAATAAHATAALAHAQLQQQHSDVAARSAVAKKISGVTEGMCAWQAHAEARIEGVLGRAAALRGLVDSLARCEIPHFL